MGWCLVFESEGGDARGFDAEVVAGFLKPSHQVGVTLFGGVALGVLAGLADRVAFGEHAELMECWQIVECAFTVPSAAGVAFDVAESRAVELVVFAFEDEVLGPS